MCKFHKELAIDIATDPATGQFDPVAYSIAIVTLARFWINRYMPDMSECDGYSNYAMATPKAIAALNRSGLNQSLEDIADFRNTNIDTVRTALKAVIKDRQLSIPSLNLPKKPLTNETFLNDSMMALYDGDPAVQLNLKPSVENAKHEPLRQAVAAFTYDEKIEPILKGLIEGAFVKNFLDARIQVNPTLLKAYSKMPERLVGAFKSCATCVGGGTGGALVSHIGCIAIPVIAGAGGTALSATMNTVMLVTSPAIAAGVTYGYDRLRGHSLSLPKIFGSAAIAFAVALGVNHFSGHDHHHSQHDMAMTKAWINALPADKRREANDNAAAFKMSLEDYALTVCRPDQSKEQTPKQAKVAAALRPGS